MPNLGTITIENKTPTHAIVDIEGVIGIPEWWQFDNAQDRVSTFNKFKDKVNAIKNLKADKVTVNIRSLGGNVNHALMIHDSLCELDLDCETVCYGYTASAATLIAQAGKKRKISCNSLYLIHQSSSVAWGPISALEETISVLNKTNDRIATLYANRSGKEKSSFEDLMARQSGKGEWLSPEDALSAGLVDEIVTMTSASNCLLDEKLIANFSYPEIPSEKTIKNDEPTKDTFGMKIKNTLSAIWAFFSFPENVEEHEISNDQLTQLNTELSNLQSKNQEKDTEIANLKEQITALKNAPGDTSNSVSKPTDNGESSTANPYAHFKGAVDLLNQIENL